MFLPRDIVSGDFYWFHKLENGTVMLAVADCTGHGVPGAMMSMIGHSLLNEIILENGITEPAQVLYQLNTKLIAALNQADPGSDANDGMDIAVCRINQVDRKLCFAGAYRPLFLIRDGELILVKGDPYPIGGGHFDLEREYKCHSMELKKGDLLYVFSDGYPDQFGGDKNKKFLKRLKKLLVDNHQTSLEAGRHSYR